MLAMPLTKLLQRCNSYLSNTYYSVAYANAGTPNKTKNKKFAHQFSSSLPTFETFLLSWQKLIELMLHFSIYY